MFGGKKMDKQEVKYDFKLDLNSRNSLKLINDRLKDDSKVLEFGPANGRLTKYMNIKRNCIVDIVEYNHISGKDAAQYARKALIGDKEGDIEKYIWADKLAEEKYDFIIFADVLEHLYNPVEVLKRCKEFLKPDGSILLSVPNIANNNIILALLNDDFKYTSLGLLDNTHIRFFTYKTIYNLADELGYTVSDVDYTPGGIGQTEVDIKNEYLVNNDISIVTQHLQGNIYQFIFELKTNNATHIEFKGIEFAYPPVVYYENNESKYSESTCLKCNSLKCGNDIYIARFNIDGLVGKDKFRFDPVEGVRCSLELLDARTDNGELKLIGTNAAHRKYETFYFMTTDPIVEFEKIFDDETYIEVKYKLNPLDFNIINSEYEKCKDKCAKMQNEYDELMEKYQGIIESTSWKLTSPLRKVKKWFNNV